MFSPECEDASRLLRDALVNIADAPRTHIVTRKQLSNAVDAMRIALDSLPVDSVGLGEPFQDWRAHAQTVADIAQALAQEHGQIPSPNCASGPMPFKAVRRKPHPRRGNPDSMGAPGLEDIPAFAKDLRDSAPEWTAIEPLLRAVPRLRMRRKDFEPLSRAFSLRAR